MPQTQWYTWLILVLFLLPVLATLLSLLPFAHWTMRIFDFPRLQLAILALFCCALCLPLNHILGWLFWPLLLSNAATAAWQLWQISAYTPWRKPQVLAYHGEDNEHSISILASNVLTPNRQAHKLLALIEQHQPDIVLTLESDSWWEQQLAGLERDYPHTVKIPLDNLYGMHLYSRLPLQNTEVLYRVREDIPSIRAQVKLRDGHWVYIHCLHPMPPSPTEAQTATERDGELLLVGKEIAASDQSCLVFGDLNDVAWSDTSRLFQRISGLLDPRVGRGLFNTFHAQYRLLRWPLDHIFHSNDFLVAKLRVLPDIGSDHFPIYGQFQYRPAAEAVQPEPETETGDHQEAREKIAAAEPLQEAEP